LPRFIFLFAFGALVVAGSQVALTLGIHPEHLASLRYILQSGAGLIVGTAMAAIGVALFSIPVGVLFEGFQEMLEEKHSSSD
jgi:hypothetical protein